MSDALSQRLAELHRRRSAIDAEIAELYAQAATGKKPRRRRNKIEPVEADQETMENVSRALAKRGIAS